MKIALPLIVLLRHSWLRILNYGLAHSLAKQL